MKIVSKIQLLPTSAQAQVLLDTLVRVNEAANWVSKEAWNRKAFQYFALSKLLYHPARQQFGLSAQLTVRVFSKVADAYKLDKKRERHFRRTGAIAYDDRILSFRDGAVSIWTLDGRQRISFIAGDHQLALLTSRQGESDLIYHRGKWFLGVTCNVEEPSIQQVDDWLGVDVGVVNLATDSDGGNYSGSAVTNVRYRHRRLRSKLQKKQTRGARRKLHELSGRERRFASDVNHCISKQIVAKTKGTGLGIAIEELTGIRDRITARRKQRVILYSWAFAQLRAFIEYKAALAGVPVIFVDPRNSSRQCSQCHHVDKANRPSQSVFRCTACDYQANADINAAMVIRSRAFASKPNVARTIAATS